MQLDEHEVIRDPPLLVRSLVVLGLVLVAFSLHTVLHLEPSVVALLGAGLLILLSGLSSKTYMAEIEWETLLFFAGLFMLVGALVKTGPSTSWCPVPGRSPVRPACGGRCCSAPTWAATPPLSASANVVATGIAKRNGHPISFWEFSKYGAIVAVVTLAITTPYLLLRY